MEIYYIQSLHDGKWLDWNISGDETVDGGFLEKELAFSTLDEIIKEEMETRELRVVKKKLVVIEVVKRD